MNNGYILYEYLRLLLCLHCCHHYSVRAEEDGTGCLPSRKGSGQTAGMQHKHRCRWGAQREGHPAGGKACVASVTGGSTVCTFPQPDLVRRTVVG